ncbi:MAG: putative P-loop ATPase protein [Chthonomonadales bacterium]|nr:putative P-loop ATPase protein [Chthonomonadales bacterium]
MRFVVITGPSGAGKTLALHSFEDGGYYTADNLPPCLLPNLADFCRKTGRERCAVVVDARSGAAFEELGDVLAQMKEDGVCVELLYLDAGDGALVQRFKETRRPHPLVSEATAGSIVEAIQLERVLLESARPLADRILDTSTMSAWELRDFMHATYSQDTRPGLLVTVTSFGFKHGLPVDADLVFDVRFLANPHYVPELKYLSGKEEAVANFVHADPLTAPFQTRMHDLVDFALPQYQREGKAYLNIAIGCTGGQHRSVVLAEDLSARLQNNGYRITIRHRDIEKLNRQARTEKTEERP